MKVIRDRDGRIISSRKDLRGIREYVGGPRAPALMIIALSELPSGEGQLYLEFMDGSNFKTQFDSLTSVCQWMRRWRNIYGAPLQINGDSAGMMDYHNSELTRLCR